MNDFASYKGVHSSDPERKLIDVAKARFPEFAALSDGECAAMIGRAKATAPEFGPHSAERAKAIVSAIRNEAKRLRKAQA